MVIFHSYVSLPEGNCCCMIGGLFFSFLPKSGSWAGLERALRISWATTVPLELLVAHVFVPRIRARFRVVLVYKYVSACLRIWAETTPSSFYLFTHCISMCMFVFDQATWTTGQLWTWSWRVSCAKLAWSWADKLSLWQDCCLLLIYVLVFLRGDFGTGFAWDCQCNKQKSDAELSRKHTRACWRNITYHCTIPLRKTFGQPFAKLARCRF